MMLAVTLALNLVLLHTPDGQALYLNAATVVTIRKPRAYEGHLHDGVMCLVHLTDGKWIGVSEDCDQVTAVVNAAQSDD